MLLILGVMQVQAPLDMIYQVILTMLDLSILASNYWNGQVGLLSIYNRALTDEEVLQNYNATKTRFGIT